MGFVSAEGTQTGVMLRHGAHSVSIPSNDDDRPVWYSPNSGFVVEVCRASVRAKVVRRRVGRESAVL